MTGMLKVGAAAVVIVILLYVVAGIVRFAVHLLSLLIPLIVVGFIAYVFYRLITHKCVANSHRLFH